MIDTLDNSKSNITQYSVTSSEIITFKIDNKLANQPRQRSGSLYKLISHLEHSLHAPYTPAHFSAGANDNALSLILS